MKRIITPAIFLSSSIACSGQADAWTAPCAADSRRERVRTDGTTVRPVDSLRTADAVFVHAA